MVMVATSVGVVLVLVVGICCYHWRRCCRHDHGRASTHDLIETLDLITVVRLRKECIFVQRRGLTALIIG